MHAHYSSVWALMDKDSFVIVIMEDFEARLEDDSAEEKSFIANINSRGYEYQFFSDMLRNKIKFQYVISNHSMGGSGLFPQPRLKKRVKIVINTALGLLGKDKKYSISHKDPIQYPPLQAGIKQIRFMYGADISDGWSLKEWNEMYDLFLCHGPNDELQLKKKFKGKTALMGYPRYDGYFSPSLCVDEVIDEFEIDRSKQTLLWMPTIDMFDDGTCSILGFAKAISKFMTDYNVIVRPHPLSFRLDTDAIEELETLNYKIDRKATRDMNSLYRVTDVVLCDHGGSAFGALYLGKKLIFLKTPGSDASVVGKNSSNQVLMQNFPVLDEKEIHNLGVLLNNEDYWRECMEQSRVLVRKFFADYRGNSSEKTVEVLSKLRMILN